MPPKLFFFKFRPKIACQAPKPPIPNIPLRIRATYFPGQFATIKSGEIGFSVACCGLSVHGNKQTTDNPQPVPNPFRIRLPACNSFRRKCLRNATRCKCCKENCLAQGNRLQGGWGTRSVQGRKPETEAAKRPPSRRPSLASTLCLYVVCPLATSLASDSVTLNVSCLRPRKTVTVTTSPG